MIGNRPRGLDSTSGFSRENSIRWVNKLLLAIDRRANNYDDIQGNDHVYRHHVHNQQTETILHLLLLLHTSTAIQHASSVLSSRRNGVMQQERWHDVDMIYSCRNRPRGVDFTSSFPREKQHTMGKQITVGKLIVLQIIMMISR